jgi:hypothetical protein
VSSGRRQARAPSPAPTFAARILPAPLRAALRPLRAPRSARVGPPGPLTRPAQPGPCLCRPVRGQHPPVPLHHSLCSQNQTPRPPRPPWIPPALPSLSISCPP